MNYNKFFLNSLLGSLLFPLNTFAMQRPSKKSLFLQEIMQEQDVISENPIESTLHKVRLNREFAEPSIVEKLIGSLDSKNDIVKKKASLALAAIGMTHGLADLHYRQWARKIDRDHFFALELAPDGSRVFPVGNLASEGSMAYILQPPLKTSLPVQHKTITEDWLFIEGEGEVALKDQPLHRQQWGITPVRPGTHVTIPVRTSFQFRTTSQEPLKFIIITRPPYPGNDEGIDVPGCWERTHIALPSEKFGFMKNVKFKPEAIEITDYQSVLYSKLEELSFKGRNTQNVEFAIKDSDHIFLSETEVENSGAVSNDTHFVINGVEYKDYIVDGHVQPEGIVKIIITRGFFDLSEEIHKKDPRVDLLKTIIKIRLSEADAEDSTDNKNELLAVYSVLSVFAYLKNAHITTGIRQEDLTNSVLHLENTRLNPREIGATHTLGCNPIEIAELLSSLILA